MTRLEIDTNQQKKISVLYAHYCLFMHGLLHEERILMRTFSILCLVAAAIVPFPGNGYSQEINQDALSHFEKALHAQDIQKRIEHYEKALAIEPGFPDALYQLGVAYLDQGSFDKAIETLTRVVPADSAANSDIATHLKDAYTFLAQEYLAEDEMDQALYAIEEALYLDELYSPALATLGKLRLKQHKLTAALDALTISLERNPRQAAAWNTFGDVHLRGDNLPAAIRAYEKALAINPDLKSAKFHLKVARERNAPHAWLQKSEYFIAKDSLAQAIEVLRNAVAAHPKNTALLQHLAWAEQEHTYRVAMHAWHDGKWTQAVDLLQRLNPEYKDAFLRLEEARAELFLNEVDPVPMESNTAQPEQLLPEMADTTLTESLTVTVNTVAEIKLPQTVNSPGGEEQVDSLVVGSAAVIPDSTVAELLAATNFLPAENSSEASFPMLDQVPANRPNVRQKTSMNAFWLAGAAGSMLFLALVLLQYRRKNTRQFKPDQPEQTATPKNENLSAQPGKQMSGATTENLFHEEVASETPVKFGHLNTRELFDQHETTAASTLLPEDSLLALQETRTIVGGIRNIEKIGRYVIEKQIGRGSMGLILKAWDPKLDRTVVIKQIALQLCRDGNAISRLRNRLYREARAAGKLNHPNIVTIYDVEELDTSSYIVMEYLDGHDLRQITHTKKPIPPGRALKIIGQISDALDFAHRNGIVHRDIKPANVILTAGDRIKVADFGIAKLPQSGTLTKTGDMIGTPFYMSPEQIEGRRVDGRSDVFSAGVVLYELLTGCRPFGGDSIPAIVYNIVQSQPKAPTKVNSNLPASLDEILQRALAKDPDDRYKTAAELRQAVGQARGEFERDEM